MRVGGAVLAACASAAVLLTACGGSSSGSGSPSTSSHTTATHERLVTATSAKKALLTIKDVGDPLRAHTFYPARKPLFCAPASAPIVAKATSSTGEVGTAFQSNKPSAFLNEDVYLYRSAAAAHAALTAVQADMDCITGHTYNDDGTTSVIAVGAVNDYSAKITAETAFGWSIRTTTDYGVQFAIVTHNALILLKYTVGLKDDPKGLPDAFDLASRANELMGRA